MVNENGSNKDKKALNKYMLIMEDFIEGRLSAPEFEKLFLELHRNDTYFYSGDASKYLSVLFNDVDSFCAATEIRDGNDIDEEELKKRVSDALVRFRKV
jgi:hypothetical protein